MITDVTREKLSSLKQATHLKKVFFTKVTKVALVLLKFISPGTIGRDGISTLLRSANFLKNPSQLAI